MYTLLLGLLAFGSPINGSGPETIKTIIRRPLVMLSDTTRTGLYDLYNKYQRFQKHKHFLEAGLQQPAGTVAIEWSSGQRNSLDSNFTISRLSAAGSADLFIINPSGHVGIGTLDPGTYKLAVEGTIGARKLQVKLGSWADYVFEPGYKLLTLAEVESFIRQHGRLPEVPSAKQVEESGIDVGANQTLLLKKIEELTLYMIELKKENQELQKRVTQLEIVK